MAGVVFGGLEAAPKTKEEEKVLRRIEASEALTVLYFHEEKVILISSFLLFKAMYGRL